MLPMSHQTRGRPEETNPVLKICLTGTVVRAILSDMKVPAAESGWCSARPERMDQQQTAAAGIAPLVLYFRPHISIQFTAVHGLKKPWELCLFTQVEIRFRVR